ncbi:MAG: hypothetical protein QOI00_1460 [Chloroflexota bacterium]|nr:hypothetical protein [Chloroflexota bacterium]
MPRVDENAVVWDQSWDWSQEGEEWSAWWGGTHPLWLGALLPRIHPYIPTGTILEIAPGHGRWTNYLKDTCDRLIGVDMAERCVEHCRRRFADSPHAEFHTNDGRSLGMVPDGSIDFAFSFDSLVHVEIDVLEAYVEQLAVKLGPDGVGFFHHSNIGSYPWLTAAAKRVPGKLLPRMISRGLAIDVVAWRAESVTGERFAAACRDAGLHCVSQELMSWEHGPYLIDAISIFTRPGSRWDREPEVLRNPFFSAEGRRMRRLYARSVSSSRDGASSPAGAG